MNGFIGLINRELSSRDLTLTDLAEEMGISPSGLSMVIKGRRKPTFEFCIRFAHICNFDPISILRLAELLPAIPDSGLLENELLVYFRQLNISNQRLAIDIVTVLKNHETSN